MTTVTQRPPLPSPQGETSANAERLLRNMNQVFSHDLPNQMVALQGLLQLLSLEESTRLSEGGREYVRRLQNAARRASEMVRFLKEMARLREFACLSEPIALSSLARELQGELQRLHPAKEFDFDWQWHVPTIVGDQRVFLQGILELCAGIHATARGNCQVQASSQMRGDAMELRFRLGDGAIGKNGAANPPAPVESMEIILAREWLALCGADLEVTLRAAAEISFSIVVPNR